MRRIQFIEIHDRGWFPSSARDAVTDTLQSVFNLADLYAPIVPRLRKALEHAGTNQIVDLCSGGGGPWLWMRRVFAQEDFPVEVCLTDKFPNRNACERALLLSAGKMRYFPEPVDVAKIPPGLQGFRTIFTSFHHFQPDEARAILQDAVEAREGIAVFEVPRRKLFTVLLTFLVPLVALGVVPFIRPFRGSRVLWTYLIPLAPLVLLFDGIVSCLRAYSVPELFDLTNGLSRSGYEWEIGEEKAGLLCVTVTYLIGFPRATASAVHAGGLRRVGNALRSGR